MDPSSLQAIIPVAGIAAILFALYLARDLISRDQGTQAMQDVAATIYRGRGGLHPPPVHDDRHPRHRRRGGHRNRHCHRGRARRRGHRRQWRPARDLHRHRLPGRRRLLDGVGLHRHVHRRQGEPAHGRGRAAQPRRAPSRSRMRGGAVSGFLVVALLAARRAGGIFVAFGGSSTNPSTRRRS